ncbi:hypothetical protein ACLB1E_24975 [Escherichia coli]
MAIGSRSLGLTNSPSTRNMAICASQARPSKFCRMPSAVANRPITQQKTAQINSQNTATFQRRG